MNRRGFSAVIILILITAILVVGGMYWYFHQSIEKRIVQNGAATSTNQKVSAATSFGPINLIISTTSTEQLDGYYQNNLGTSTSLLAIPIYQLKPTSADPSSPGGNPGSYGLVVYNVGSTTLSFYNSSYTVGYRGLTLSQNGIDISTSSVSIAGNNFQPEHGVNLFSYNGKQYLLGRDRNL